jgi:hypothetical protein
MGRILWFILGFILGVLFGSFLFNLFVIQFLGGIDIIQSFINLTSSNITG